MTPKPIKISNSELIEIEKHLRNKSAHSIGNFLYNGYRIQISKFNQTPSERISIFAKKRRAQGLCVACGKKVKRVNIKTLKPYKYCDTHHKIAIEKNKERNLQKKQA